VSAPEPPSPEPPQRPTEPLAGDPPIARPPADRTVGELFASVRATKALAGIGLLILAVGSLGPWVTVLAFSEAGTKGDGKITLVLAFVRRAGPELERGWRRARPARRQARTTAVGCGARRRNRDAITLQPGNKDDQFGRAKLASDLAAGSRQARNAPRSADGALAPDPGGR
jgi:hypothetical protein